MLRRLLTSNLTFGAKFAPTESLKRFFQDHLNVKIRLHVTSKATSHEVKVLIMQNGTLQNRIIDAFMLMMIELIFLLYH